jgi:acetyltransferase-like isoleucine patch superfamily enzyme
VDSDTLIGMGVTVFMGVHIGENVVVVNGQHVFRSIPSGTVCSQLRSVSSSGQ